MMSWVPGRGSCHILPLLSTSRKQTTIMLSYLLKSGQSYDDSGKASVSFNFPNKEWTTLEEPFFPTFCFDIQASTEKLFYNIWTLFVKVQFPFLNLRSLSRPCLASKSWWGQNISYKKVWTLNFFTKTDVLCSWVLCNRILQKKSELVVTNQVQVASNENIKLSHGREWGSNREMSKGKILKSLHS